jgi:hypothetical protein
MGKEFALLQLIEWIRNGDARIIERYLDTQSGSVNIDGQTSRVCAVSSWRLLLHKPLRFSCALLFSPRLVWCSQEGTTALIVACECKQMDIVKILLKYGAKPNVPNKVRDCHWRCVRYHDPQTSMLV